MQSGITASTELLTAFNDIVTNPSHRGLLVTIRNESLVPLPTSLPATSSFHTDLTHIAPSLQPTTPLYILLRQHESAPDGFVAITYVPDSAPVRQKTLFAATRLTLVRALGAERFRSTRFVTEPAELTSDGWRRYELGEAADGPLTEEEKVLRQVMDEEETGKNTTERRQIVSGPVRIGISEEARGALEGWGRGEGGNLVQLRIDLSSETIQLASTSSASAADLASTISSTEPRYSFFRYTLPPNASSPASSAIPSSASSTFPSASSASTSSSASWALVFIFTCPPESKIKARMVYASSKLTFLESVAKGELGLGIAKKLEASSPTDITAQTIEDEFAVKTEEKTGFSRPKRPGRR